jgi:Maltokinase N-terminal cap domain
MAVIHHNTTMSPGKLELLRPWLPAQPWYLAGGRAPELAKAGGFRLDDPAGEVGIEFLVVSDGSPGPAATYQVPLTYRAEPLAAAADALIGTAEHGVLGRRWIYDGTQDPVLVAQLVALVQGQAQPQAQNLSDTPDPTVVSQPVTGRALRAAGSTLTGNGPAGTGIRVQAIGADGTRSGELHLRIHRILRPGGDTGAAGDTGQPCVSATWRLADGTQARGTFVTARYLP